MSRHLLVLIGLLIPQLAAAEGPCPEATTPEALQGRIENAEEAYSSMEPEAFQTANDLAKISLGCLDEPLAPLLAARYHRMIGIGLFVEDRGSEAARSFAAARKAGPRFEFPESLVPEGHQIHTLYAEVDLSTDGRKPETAVAEPGPAKGDGPTHRPFEGLAGLLKDFEN